MMIFNASYIALRDKIRRIYQRILPFPDMFLDRFERAHYVGAGQGSSIYDSCLIFDFVVIGEGVWIGPFTILDGSGGGLTIGDHCAISAGVQIYTHDTVERTLNDLETPRRTGAVSIRGNTYVGPNAVISLGAKIGHHCVIGANAFVKRNQVIPDFSVYAGAPAKLIGIVERENGAWVTQPLH